MLVVTYNGGSHHVGKLSGGTLCLFSGLGRSYREGLCLDPEVPEASRPVLRS